MQNNFETEFVELIKLFKDVNKNKLNDCKNQLLNMLLEYKNNLNDLTKVNFIL